MRTHICATPCYLFTNSGRREITAWRKSKKRTILRASPCILAAAAESQMIGTTMRRVDWGCRSSSESAANGSGLISAIIPSPWRYARGTWYVNTEEERRKREGGTVTSIQTKEREKVTVRRWTPSSSRRWPSTFAPKSRLGQTAGHAPIQVAPSHGWMTIRAHCPLWQSSFTTRY